MTSTLKAPESKEERLWERGWNEHDIMQLRRLARLSLAEKLLWLEQAHHVVLQLQAQRVPKRSAR